MYFKQRVGKIGEDLSCKYLEEKGYKIIDRNFRCSQGEIDIIAKDNKTREFVFIEVKTRTNFKYGKPCESVNTEKRKHIYKVAKYYIFKKRLYNIAVRLDVIEVYIKNSGYAINHIEKAFFG